MTSKEIFDLITRFENSPLQTMSLSTGEFSLELGKGSAAVSGGEAAAPVSAPTASAAVPEDAPAITAPLVGTYYAASTPGGEPFVHVGDTVKKGQTLCLIEAMKMMSEIPAPCDCMITEALKMDGTLAAFGEPLFRYRPC